MNESVQANKKKALLFSIYRGLTADWFFIYAIDSIFYSDVKMMSFSQISLIATIASLSYIIVCLPTVRLVRKIGTVRSTQIGTAFLLISAVMMVFDPIVIFISQPVFMFGVALKNASDSKILKDNLKMYGLSKDYTKYSSISKFIWTFVNAISTILAGFMFDAWPYSPIVTSCVIMLVMLILSFFVKNEKESFKKANNLPLHNVKLEKFEFIKLFKYRTTWLLLFFSILLFGFISGGMDVAKLPFQELNFSTITITTVCLIAYFLRAITAFSFSFVYQKLRFNSIYIVISLFSLGALLLGLGGILLTGTACLIIMAIGISLLYASRDPFYLIREDFVMNSNGLTKRQTLLQITSIGTYIGRLIVTFSISIILNYESIFTVFLLLLILTPICIIISLLLRRKQKMNKYDVFY